MYKFEILNLNRPEQEFFSIKFHMFCRIRLFRLNSVKWYKNNFLHENQHKTPVIAELIIISAWKYTYMRDFKKQIFTIFLTPDTTWWCKKHFFEYRHWNIMGLNSYLFGAPWGNFSRENFVGYPMQKNVSP